MVVARDMHTFDRLTELELDHMVLVIEIAANYILRRQLLDRWLWLVSHQSHRGPIGDCRAVAERTLRRAIDIHSRSCD